MVLRRLDPEGRLFKWTLHLVACLRAIDPIQALGISNRRGVELLESTEATRFLRRRDGTAGALSWSVLCARFHDSVRIDYKATQSRQMTMDLCNKRIHATSGSMQQA
jgi:hypothetical protein